HSYDAADRLQPTGSDTGIAYDNFGRTTTTPSNDVTGGANLGVAFYNNDLMRAQTQVIGQNTTVQTWTLDPALRFSGWTTTVNGAVTATKTNHYDSEGDAPSWIAETSD